MLSVRPDLVGEAISDDLAHLRDHIPPFDTDTAKAIVEAELEKPLSALFASFEETPVAAASIAQVHFATLPEGQEVAVKILRPNIHERFARDMDLLYWLATVAERKLPQYQRLRFVDSVLTFKEMVSFELDLRYEAAAASELKENTKNDHDFYVPEVYWNRTSERVLTTERIRGISLNDRAALEASNIDLGKLVEIAAKGFFNQVFRDGFFHADLHPGNVFAMPDNSLAVVDFGIMGRISRQDQLYLAEMLWAFLNKKYEKVAEIHRNAGFVPSDISIKQFALANRAIAEPIFNKPLNEISVGKLLGQLFMVAEHFQMQTQPQLLLLQKTMVLAEGMGRMFKPDVNMWKLAEPLIAEWAKTNLTPQAQIKETAVEGLQALKRLPGIVRHSEQVLNELQQGGIRLHPKTVEAMRGGNRGVMRQWLNFAWGALVLLSVILILEILL